MVLEAFAHIVPPEATGTALSSVAYTIILFLSLEHVLASSKSLVTRWIVTTFVAASLLTLPWLLTLPPGLGVMASAACATAAIKACSAALFAAELPCLKAPASRQPGALLLACLQDILHPHTLVPKPTRATRPSPQQPLVKPDAHAWQPAPPLLAQLKESLCWCLAFDAACELLCRLWGPGGQQPGGLLPISLLLCMTQWLQFAMGFSVVCLVANLAHRVAQLLQLPLPKALREGRLLLPPRAMKDVLLSTSLADMWGKKWHQYFRSDHYNLAQRPTQAALDWAGSLLGTGVTASPHWRNIRRAITVMAVFVFNGVIHEYMNWAGLGISDGMHLAFFTVHGLGLLLEEKLVAPGKASSAFSAAARRAVLVGFIAATSPLFALPWLKAGYHLHLMRPLHVAGPIFDVIFHA